MSKKIADSPFGNQEREITDRTQYVEDIKKQLRKRPKRRKANMKRLIIAATIFVLQLALIIFGLYKMHGFFLTSYIIFQIIAGVVVIKILHNHKNPSYKIAWISVILLIPVLGLVFYIMWGRGRYPRSIKEQLPQISKMTIPLQKHNDETEIQFKSQFPSQERIMNYLRNAGFPIYSGTSVEYYAIGDEFFPQLIEDLKKAEKFIFIEFFIISEGQLWQEIYSVLKDKAQNGVEVRILYDDFGCITCLPKNFEKELMKNGIKTAAFNKIKPVVNNFYMNYRNHQKICVIDGNIGYTGGANIADEYINRVEAFGHWKDTGIKISGRGVWSLTVTFLQSWQYSTFDKKIGYVNLDYSQYMPSEEFCMQHSSAGGFVQPFSDGPLRTPTENEAEFLYMQMINNAKRYIYITTPYLVPDNEMITALRMAAKSGVDVRIVTPGIPDKKIVNYVTNSYYGILLEAGIRIYEYLPGFIHAKNVVCDDETSVVGTVNMDFRSFYLHFENGIWICGNDVVNDVREDFLKVLEYSREIDYNEWKCRPLWKKVLQAILNLFAPLF